MSFEFGRVRSGDPRVAPHATEVENQGREAEFDGLRNSAERSVVHALSRFLDMELKSAPPRLARRREATAAAQTPTVTSPLVKAALGFGAEDHEARRLKAPRSY